MSRCKQCNIEVLDETERCPLCHSVLEPTIEVENMYPDVKIKTRRMMLLSRIYLFVAIVAEAVLVVVNHYGDFETAWSLVTGLIFFYSYVGPAVIITLRPFRSSLPAKNLSRTSMIFSGSSIRPFPTR